MMDIKPVCLIYELPFLRILKHNTEGNYINCIHNILHSNVTFIKMQKGFLPMKFIFAHECNSINTWMTVGYYNLEITGPCDSFDRITGVDSYLQYLCTSYEILPIHIFNQVKEEFNYFKFDS